MFSRRNNSATPKTRTRKMRLLLSYAPDWIVTIGLAAAFFLLDKIDGFRREFSLTDTSIQHSYTVHERVPNWMLLVICFGGPTVIMPIVNLLTVRSWWDWHNSMLGLILGLATTGAVTQVVKVTVGRPRPDAIARCKPVPDAHDHAVFGLVTTAICTETDAYMMKDGWRSFFSGHSSLAFAGLGFLSFYLAGKLHLFDERGHTGKAWIALTPLTGALLVAISRTMDYRHHWQDVLVGSIAGLVFSYFSYRQYYPTLESPYSHKPYSPRIPREDYRDSVLPIVGHHPQDDDEYAPSVITKPGSSPAPYNRRQNNGASYSAVNLGEYATSYPPPRQGQGHAPSQSGSGGMLRPEARYDEQGVGGGHHKAGSVEETTPRPSGEPLVEMYGREHRHEQGQGGGAGLV
ncbi:hypothetical protein FRC08_001420 [Ceratobasidium sp. 394]|nr:hypothetical protein FRC08_001420 [Ceratobasidium sp. 394]